MESSGDRVEVNLMLAVPEAIAVAEVVGAPEGAALPQTPGRPPGQRPTAARTREFDDIPSVIRALLVGYDEV